MNYVEEIADEFRERCHNTATLGPADFTLIAEWEKQEIPKEVVLSAISVLCTSDIRSVVEINGGVKQYFVDWLQREAGFRSASC